MTNTDFTQTPFFAEMPQREIILSGTRIVIKDGLFYVVSNHSHYTDEIPTYNNKVLYVSKEPIVLCFTCYATCERHATGFIRKAKDTFMVVYHPCYRSEIDCGCRIYDSTYEENSLGYVLKRNLLKEQAEELLQKEKEEFWDHQESLATQD